MALVEAIQSVARQPASIQARARLAIVLEQMGTLEASRVWASTVRLAAARGQFFPALFLLRLHIPQKALQTQLLVELAERFGRSRNKEGKAMPPPIIPSVEVEIPEELDRQIYLAVRLGCQIKNLGIPEGSPVPEIPLFGELPTAEFVAFALLLKEVMLTPGQAFIQQDSIEQSVFLLANGRVKVTKRLPDGQQKELAVTVAPAVIGEMSLLTAVPRRATVTAIDKGLAWRVDANALKQLVHGHPTLMAQLNLVVKRRLLNNLIRSSELFRAAGAQLDALLDALEVLHIGPDSQVFDQGEEPPGLFVLLHGEAEVWTTSVDGEKVRLAMLNEGGAFGEMSLLTGKPTAASVWMPKGGVLLHLPPERFHSIRQALPSLEVKLAELMVVRQGELQSMVSPFEHFEEIEPEEEAWMTGEFGAFKG